MTDFIKTSVVGFVIDPNSKAIINNNTEEYNQFQLKRKQIIESKRLAKKVNELDDKIDKLTDLVSQILNRKIT